MVLLIRVLQSVCEAGLDGIFLKARKVGPKGPNRPKFHFSVDFSQTVQRFIFRLTDLWSDNLLPSQCVRRRRRLSSSSSVVSNCIFKSVGPISPKFCTDILWTKIRNLFLFFFDSVTFGRLAAIFRPKRAFLAIF